MDTNTTTESDPDPEGRPAAHHWQLAGVMRGSRAIDELDAGIHVSAPRLEVVASGATAVDAYTGAVVRAAIDAHLERDPANAAGLWEPRSGDAWGMLYDLLRPLPSRCQPCGDHPTPARDPRILLPAMQVEDPEYAELVTAAWLPGVGRFAGLTTRHTRWLIEAGAALIDNGLVHATDSPIGVLAAACLEPLGNDVQMVAIDLGRSIAAQDEPQAALRDVVGRSRGGVHGLVTLADLAERRSADVSLRLASGTGRARYRHGRWRYSRGPLVPGFVAGYEIHR
jgi:hypothetical protein